MKKNRSSLPLRAVHQAIKAMHEYDIESVDYMDGALMGCSGDTTGACIEEDARILDDHQLDDDVMKLKRCVKELHSVTTDAPSDKMAAFGSELQVIRLDCSNWSADIMRRLFYLRDYYRMMECRDRAQRSVIVQLERRDAILMRALHEKDCSSSRHEVKHARMSKSNHHASSAVQHFNAILARHHIARRTYDSIIKQYKAGTGLKVLCIEHGVKWRSLTNMMRCDPQYYPNKVTQLKQRSKYNRMHPRQHRTSNHKWRKRHQHYIQNYNRKWREVHPDYMRKYHRLTKSPNRAYWRRYYSQKKHVQQLSLKSNGKK